MGTEILIIIAYFTGMCVPVATVAVFLRMDANPETAKHLPTADSYFMPGEGEPRGEEGELEERRLLGHDGSVGDN
jgi:hypothetical protein